MKLLLTKVTMGFVVLVASLLNSFSAFSQIHDTHPNHPGHERCSFTKMDSIRHAENPDLQTNEEFEQWIEKLIAEKKKFQQQGLIINGVYQIPIVVHVVHDGEPIGTGRNLSVAAIQSQIDVLNEDFRRIFGTNGYNTHPDGADTEIEFCLARRRPDGSAFPAGEDGINRVDAGAQGWGGPTFGTAFINGTIKPFFTATQFGGWDPAVYMNFWSIDLQGGLLGYAQFPTTVLGGMGCNAQNVTTDGVVMDYQTIGKAAVTGFPGPFNEGRTATHEVGHWLGLRHIWGDGGCGVDDFCLDTPESDASNGGCPTGHVSCGSVDMIENYMDYTNDLCMNIFTNDQKMRMRIVLENSPIRASLITSDACIPPAVSDASITGIIDPDGDNCAGSITPTVILRNRGASNLTSAEINYTLNGVPAGTFSWTGNIAPGGENNVVLPPFTAPLGVHEFRAYSELPNGVIDPDPTYDTTSIMFAVSNGYQPNYTQDFETGIFPPDVRWDVDNPNGDCYEWVGQACVSSTGVVNNVAAMMTNTNNGTNQDEFLYTPFYILPCNASAANLTFDKAYRRRVNASNDRLRVEMSTDCGATWGTLLFDQSGGTLDGPNGTSGGAYWIPTDASEWQNVNLDLMPYVSGVSQSVQFRFRATNAGNGGNLFVDNLNYTATTPGEIEVTVAGVDVLDGGIYDFGAGPVGAPVTATFTITNTGTSDLILTGPITVTGGPEFVLNSTFGTTTVPAGGTTTFSIDFTASGAGPFAGTVSFGTNDCDEGIYDFLLSGTGDVSPPTAGFTVSPSGICEGQTVTFTSTSVGAVTYAWTFPGGTPNTATGVGPHIVTYATAGSYNASLTVTSPYGSDTDTQTNAVVVASGTGTPIPFAEGFDSGTFAPAGWGIGNGGNQAITWTQDPNNNGTAPTAGNSARIDFFSTNTAGDQDSLFVLPADMTGFISAQMTFDKAYARYNGTYNDRLQVLVSSDCGASWAVEFDQASTVLATDPDQTGGYTAPATWVNETIDLSAYAGQSNVQIAFVGISGYGQYLYIDNVNLTGVAGCNDPDVPTVTAAAGPHCDGDLVTLNIAGNLNDATQWAIYSGSCGGTLLGTTTTGTFDVTVSAGANDYFVRGEGGCVTPGSCGTVSITAGAIPAAPTVTVVDNCGSSILTATGTNLLWSTGETTASITVTTAGAYTVTQTVAGCTSPAGSGTAVPLAVPAAPTVTVVDNCGSSTLTATGTNLLWSTGETTASITVTTAGAYTVTQTVGGCTSPAGSGTAAPLAVPAAPTVTVVDNCGSSTLTATGTNLLWSTGETTASITVTTAGASTVTQTVGGCTSPAGSGTAAPLAIPAAPTVTVVDNCGSSTLTATGINLLWSTGETTASITVTAAGSYTVTQTVGGCTSAPGSGAAAPLAVPAAPTVTVVDNCGSSTLTATGTNLLWSTGETTASITVTTAGAYTVTQTVGGCISPAGSGTANPLSNPTITAGTLTDPSSCGNNDGSIVVNGTGTGTVTWTGASSGNSGVVTLPYTISGLTAGAYTITFDNGCPSNTLNESLSDPVAPAPPTVTVVDNCGSSTLTATGTNLLWSTGVTTASITVTTAGSYTVTQTVGGCTSAPGTGTANPLAIPATPVVTVVNNCGSSTLTTSGTNLSWSTGETTASITVTTPGLYTVTQTVGGCTSIAGSGTAAPLVAPTITTGTLTNPSSCGNNNGSIVVNGTGTGTVTWTGTSSGNSGVVTLPYTISGLTAGSYAITFDDGCTSNTLNETLSDPAAPATPVVTVVDNCGSSTLTTSGTNLLWSTGETTASITVTTGGVYTVTQTVGGCTSIAGSGTANPLPIPANPVVTVVDNCGSSTLTTSGSNLSWSTGETTASITVTTGGLYTVTQTVGGCISIAGSGTANPLPIPATPVVTVVDNCGSSMLTTSGTNLLWSTGETTASITVTTGGLYTVTQTVGGCTSVAGSGTANPTPIPATPVVTVVDNCGSSTLTTSGTNLLWSTGETTASITVTTGGLYTVTQTVGGCTSIAGSGTANPTAIPSAPTVTVVDNCGSSTLTATGSNLLWSTGETTASITVTSAGAYTVTQTVGGCTSSAGSGTANPLATPSAPVITVVDNCGSSTLTATGTNLLWSTGETTASITVTTTGAYTVTQTVGGCTSAPGTATANPLTSPAPVTVNETACGSYTWSANGTTYTTGGTFTETIAASNGCDSVVTLNLTILQPTTGSETASGCDFYTWPTSGLTYTSSGTYTTTLTGSNGCDSIVTLNLTINTPTTGTETATVCDQYVWSADGNTYTSSGTYTAILTNAAGCDSIVTLDLTVQGLPSVVLALTIQEFCDSDADVTLAGGTPAGGTYAGTGVTGGVFSPSTAGIGSHTITYSYTDANGCSATDTDVITVQDCANIDEIEEVIVSIHPNPTNGVITFVSNGAMLEEVRIFDNAGKLIDVLRLDGATHDVDISDYARGVYQFQINAGSSAHWERVVKH